MRRPKGSGTVVLKGGKYYARARRNGEEIYGPARDSWDEADSDRKNWARAEPPKRPSGRMPTLQQWAFECMNGAYGAKLETSTYVTNEGYRLRFINDSALGSMRLNRISRTDVENWMTSLRAERHRGKEEVWYEPPAPRTVHRIMAYLSKLFSLAVRDGLIPANPTANVERPRVLPRPNRVLESSEAAQLLDPQDRTDCLIVVAMLTGLRRSEILRLEWSHVTRTTLTVPARKNAASVKTVPLAPEAYAALNAQPRRSNYVFTAESGLPLSPRNFTRDVHERLIKLGFPPDMRPQDLRGSFGTLLIQGGTDLKTVQELMRHASAKTTMDMYLRTRTPVKTAAVTRLSRHLKREAKVQGRDPENGRGSK